jgi:threonine synthase
VVQYQSTRGHKETLSFQDVILSGLAPDKGLYLPDSLYIENLNHLTEEDLSYEDFVKTIFIALDKETAKYVDDLSLYSGFENSPEPVLKELNDSTVVMELFHGPTKSFKDYALQPLGAIADKRLNELGERGLVLVATSGDTGSAAIQAVKDSDNIDIVVLHPADKISEYQRKQMTSVIKDNVFNIAVEGSYDDCQRIAKEILSENPFDRRIISLNSINWLRVMGQVSYYVWLTKQFTAPINVAIPSGNFGNAYSAWFGRSHGLKINQIMCTTNVNDVLKRFIDSGILEPQTTQPSVAPSMDIQIPSSLERLIFDLDNNSSNFYESLKENNKASLSEESIEKLQHVFSSQTFDDEDIKDEIKLLNEKFEIVFDPHTVTSLRMALDTNTNLPTVAVATASPEKFSNVISPIIDDFSEVNIENDEDFMVLDVNKDNIVESIKAKFD